MGELTAQAWRANWIAAPVAGDALPVFRRVVRIEKPFARAEIRICGLGHFELLLNGENVGDEVLSPGWTNYRKTCLFVTHDITARLLPGENEFRVMLGNGMYNVIGGRYRKFKGSFGPPMLIAEISIQFTDGTTDLVVTDDTWECLGGPITFSCIYGGEDYDARRAQLHPSVNAAAARIVEGPGGEMVEQFAPPSRVMQTFATVRVTEPQPKVRVHDLGQNFSGWPAIRVRGPAGAKLTLIPGELLDDTGRVTQKHTGAPVEFNYTLAGGGDEHWRPRFSLTGFRYVEVRADAGVEMLDLTGEFVHAALQPIGQFDCSNDLLNRIHGLILAAIRSNMHSVLTDCPHREKLGWLEQTHLMGPSIACNFDIRDYYRKICRDMRDAQQDNGCVPTIAPQYTSFQPPWDVFNDSPEWGSAIVLCPWLIHQRTGDRAILEENYGAMTRYVAYLASRCDSDGIIAYGLSDWYDIVGGERPGFCKLTPPGVTATAHYFLDLAVMEKVALLMGREDEARRHAAERQRIHRAFNARFFKGEQGCYASNSQCANAIALALDLVEAPDRPRVLANLIADIRARENHITAGDIGFRYVLQALSGAGRDDVIFDLLNRTDPPSYGAQLRAGATSLTEAWDANPQSSQNHLMLGHAEAWFYETLAGIRIDHSQPEDRRIVIQPTVVGDVMRVAAHTAIPAGRVGCAWERIGRRFVLRVTIPDGKHARVRVPAADSASVRCDPRARAVGQERGVAVFEAAGGNFTFETILPVIDKPE